MNGVEELPDLILLLGMLEAYLGNEIPFLLLQEGYLRVTNGARTHDP